MEFPSESIKLVEELKKRNLIKSPNVAQVMKECDRADFAPMLPYEDSPSPIGYNTSVSAPSADAMILELLADTLSRGKRALDLGCGSGYLSLLMSKMMNEGFVYGVDHIPELVKLSETNINKNNSKLIEDGKIVFRNQDFKEGLPEFAPYDVIFVGGALKKIPRKLLPQIALGGRMLVPYTNREGKTTLLVCDKNKDGTCTIKPCVQFKIASLGTVEEQMNQTLNKENTPLKETTKEVSPQPHPSTSFQEQQRSWNIFKEQNMNQNEIGKKEWDFTYKNVTLKLIQANLIDSVTDVIVCPVDMELELQDPQALEISNAAGPELMTECKKIISKRGGIPIYTGECVYTKGYDLLTKWVIHTVAPVWYGGRLNEPWLLEKSMLEPMKKASQLLKSKSISFPAFTNRKYKIPLDVVCATMFKTFIKYIDEFEKTNTINEMYIVVSHDRSRVVFGEYFKKCENMFNNQVLA